jgi:PAS domain-containing protein
MSNNIDQIIKDIMPFTGPTEHEAYFSYLTELEWIKSKNLDVNIYAAVFDLTKDYYGGFVYASPRFTDLLGYSAEELKVSGILAKIGGGHDFTLMERINSYGGSLGVPIESVEEFITKKGDKIDLWWRSIPGMKYLYVYGMPDNRDRKIPAFEDLMITKYLYHNLIRDEYDILRGLIETIGTQVRERDRKLFENPGYIHAVNEQMIRFENAVLKETGLDLGHQFDKNPLESRQFKTA